MRKYFNNSEYQKAYQTEGFVKLKIFNEKEIAAIKEFVSTYEWPDSVFYSSSYLEDKNKKKRAQDYVWEMLQPKIKDLLIDVKPVGSYVFSKPKGIESKVIVHQDPSFADVNDCSTMAFWCSLIPTVKDNGALVFLPGSQHLNKVPVTLPKPVIPYYEEKYLPIYQENEVIIETEIGEVLFFDNRIIHYSYPNLLDDNRLAIATSLIPKEANLIMYSINNDGKEPFYNIHQLNEDILLNIHPMDFHTTAPVILKQPFIPFADPYKKLLKMYRPSLFDKIWSNFISKK